MRRNRNHTELQTDFLNACFERYDGTFASGVRANNKLVFERVRGNPHLEHRLFDGMEVLAREHHPDMLVANPLRGNRPAIELAWRLGTALMLLQKDSETGQLSFYGDGAAAVQSASRIVIIEDVINRLTTTQKMLSLQGVGERAVACVAAVDRGDRQARDDIGIPVGAVINMYVPAILSPTDRLWDYADDV